MGSFLRFKQLYLISEDECHDGRRKDARQGGGAESGHGKKSESDRHPEPVRGVDVTKIRVWDNHDDD